MGNEVGQQEALFGRQEDSLERFTMRLADQRIYKFWKTSGKSDKIICYPSMAK